MTTLAAGPSAWDPEPAILGAGVVTLVEGSSFSLSGRTGDMDPNSPHGLFFRDTRIVATWRLRIDGITPEPLAVFSEDPFHARFVQRLPPRAGRAETDVLFQRDRYVGSGMREDLCLRNLSHFPTTCTIRIAAFADFADLFEVKESRLRSRGELSIAASATDLRFGFTFGDSSRGVRISAEGATFTREGLEFIVSLPPHTQWRTTVRVQPWLHDADVAETFPMEQPMQESAPAQRLRSWRKANPVVQVQDSRLRNALVQSQEDLGALRIFDPRHPEEVAVAAGAPWFMALYGRDSLLSSYFALPLDQNLALGTLQALARAQGSKVDPQTEEEPGRILHETRLGMDSSLALGGGSVYYGSVDATPLFVMLLGELRRWGLAGDVVDRLLPHADRALEWMTTYGDADGDGFIEYQRKTDKGIANQGWKDSWNGVTYADGRVPQGPIALCEVQGYAYSAYLARAYFAEENDDPDLAAHWFARAYTLRARFNEQFWLPEQGWFAMGLDGQKRPIDALASNMGHCLWSGIIDEDKAASVAEHLMSPQMFTGYGVRTLATTMAAYNPMSYHNGSVWPHDNAIIAAGLMRYGFDEHAQRIAEGLLDASVSTNGSLPELFCGFDRQEFGTPVPFPAACSPQAWAAATPVQLLRTLLRIDPWIPRGQIWVYPSLPDSFGSLRIDNLPVGGSRVTINVGDAGVSVTGLPDSVELVSQPRQPMTAAT